MKLPDKAFILALFLFINSLNLYAQIYQYVDPLIGSEGKGNVFIGPCCPFGMIKPGPDCVMNSNTGYSPDLNIPVYGFSQVHVSGTGGGPKYGNISIMPFSGNTETIDLKSIRENEEIELGYYSVFINNRSIRTEITASERTAFYKFTFNNQDRKGIKIDLGQFLGESYSADTSEAQRFVGSQIEIISNSELRGYTCVKGGWNKGNKYTVYFSAIFNSPFTNFSTWKNSVLFPKQYCQFDNGHKTGAFLFFDDDNQDTIKVKIGISFVSCTKARENINIEIPNWNFNLTLNEVQQKWENILHTVEIDKDASIKQKQMFYTALYHTMLMPTDRSNENPLWNNSCPYYDDFYAIWDTYRTSLPLIVLLKPSRAVDIVNSILQIFKHDGYLPDARSGNCNGRTQGGSNAEIVIADVFTKGLVGIDYDLALNAMIKDATVPPENEEKEGRGGLDEYNRLGYLPINFKRAGTRTVEYSYNDFCISEVAKGLKNIEIYERFYKKADNWQNLWRNVEDYGTFGFIMPKDKNGEWVDSIECLNSEIGPKYVLYTPRTQEWEECVCWWCGFFYEGNSWEYSLSIPHDVAMLIKKSGGDLAFQKRLDNLFNLGFYNVSNEPSFLSPTLYHWIGRPDLSSELVHKIINKNFSENHDGIPGNDDSGAMSSWLAFHMMGLYPNAGQPYYLINTPFFKKSIIHLENGRDFQIVAENLSPKNKCIISASLNGEHYSQSWIEHKNITNGGVLKLEMGEKPSKDWGTKAPPPSKSLTNIN